MRIAEVAERSGLTPPTLRYYEKLGLVPVAGRSPAGYRDYDESVLDRLTFITRAKALGCSLEEIAGLMPHWDSGRCAPVQQRLRELASAKLHDTRIKMARLESFAADLGRIAGALGAHTPDGPCDEQCGCLREPPFACTLEMSAVPERIAEWQRLLARVGSRSAIEGGLRLEFDGGVALEDLARLVAAEQACCGFFAFALTVDRRGVALEVRAPEAAQAVVAALFGGEDGAGSRQRIRS